MRKLGLFQTLSMLTLLSVFTQIGANKSFAQNAEGGGGTGGGGTHVCFKKDDNGNLLTSKNKPIINSVELYDLYEAREVRRYKLIDPQSLTANELLNGAMKKIFNRSPLYAYTILENLKYYSAKKYITHNKQYNIIKDINLVFLDEDCEYRELAQWRESYKSVFINGSLVDLFSRSQLNVAGLALHEAVYAFDRKIYGQKVSDHARDVVGQAFSDQELWLTPESADCKYNCASDVFDMHFREIHYGKVFVSSSIKNRITVRLSSLSGSKKTYISLYKNDSTGNGEAKCIIDENKSYCDFEIDRRKVSILNFNMETEESTVTVKDCTVGDYSQELPKVSVKVEIFENNNSRLNQDIEFTSLPLSRCSYENGVKRVTYKKSGIKNVSIIVPYNEGIEKDVLSLNLELKNIEK